MKVDSSYVDGFEGHIHQNMLFVLHLFKKLLTLKVMC